MNETLWSRNESGVGGWSVSTLKAVGGDDLLVSFRSEGGYGGLVVLYDGHTGDEAWRFGEALKPQTSRLNAIEVSAAPTKAEGTVAGLPALAVLAAAACALARRRA